MSSKELLYIEDALGHAEFLSKQCQDAVNTLQDPQLKAQAQQLVDKNRQIFGRRLRPLYARRYRIQHGKGEHRL